MLLSTIVLVNSGIAVIDNLGLSLLEDSIVMFFPFSNVTLVSPWATKGGLLPSNFQVSNELNELPKEINIVEESSIILSRTSIINEFSSNNILLTFWYATKSKLFSLSLSLYDPTVILPNVDSPGGPCGPNSPLGPVGPIGPVCPDFEHRLTLL